MKFVKSFDEIKIAYHKIKGDNSKPTLIFLHGVGGNYTTWNKELEFFKRKNYPCIAIDLRGHGQSDAPNDFKKYDIEYFAKDVEAVINKENIDNFCLIGHSIGAGIASTFHLITNKQAKKLILIEPSIVYPFEHDHLLNTSSFVTKMLRKIAYNKKLNNDHFLHFEDVDLSEIGIKEKIHLIAHLIQITPIRSLVFALDNGEKYFDEHFNDVKKFFENYQNPLLVISSDDDEICTPENAQIIADLNKKQGMFYMLHDAGHMSIVNKANEICDVLFTFLEN